ncbi:MAG: glycosyltransferase [Alphaproteobacteria bacterium]|nr:glycosyltransferase [Alphaproteobacteria bacterium]
MEPPHLPLVSIVTPVHNGAAYLAECVESVTMQRGVEFEHVIVDNASTDDSRAIANRYAERDPRIRVVECADKLPIIANWNRALGFASEESTYVWVLPADDALIKDDALARMVAVAERHPRVAVVASLRRRGGNIQCRGLDPGREAFNGREIVRLFMREEVFAFSPTGSLFRRDLIDAHKPFYPDHYLHADLAAFFEVLDRVDFGFVHDVLMFSREHDQSVTATVANRKGSQFRDGLLMLKEFGPRYFEPDELAEIETRFLRRYYRFLVRSAILLRERQLFSYHAEVLHKVGRYPRVGALTRAAIGELERAILQPFLAVAHVRARINLYENGSYIWDDQAPK